MPDRERQHYLITPHEAEFLACYRLLNTANQDAITALVASLITGVCQIPVELVKLSVVSR